MRCLMVLLVIAVNSLVIIDQAPAQIAQRETLYVDDGNGTPCYTETGSPWATLLGFGWNGQHRYVQLDDPSNINQTARWTPDIATNGYYAVSFYLPATSNSRDHCLYIVSSSGITPDSSWHDQNDNSGNWINLGVHYFTEGMVDYVEVVNDSTSTTGYFFRADATRFILGPDYQDIEPERRNGYDYGKVSLMENKDWVLRIYNIGGAPLTIDQLTFQTGAFSLYEPSTPVHIEARGHEDFTIRFVPFFDQVFDDTVKIISDDADEPCLPIPLRGEGLGLSIVVNDEDGAPWYVEKVGEWESSNGIAQCPGIVNLTSRYTIQSVNPGAKATYTPYIPFAADYRIEFALPLTAAASSNALYVICPGGGAAPESTWLNQNTEEGCEWRLLGVYYLVPGWENSVSVINDGTGFGYVLRTDLMKFTLCSPIAVESEISQAELPKTYVLLQNYPNPFNASTEIRYHIPKDGHVTLKVFNILGQEVRTLVDADQKAGGYETKWDGRDAGGQKAASGLYFCRLKAADFSKTIKMVLVR